VATPSIAATVVVPRRIASLGLAARASVTVSVAPGTVLPSESCSATRTGGEITTFASLLAGSCVAKARCGVTPLALTPADEDWCGPAGRSRSHACGMIARNTIEAGRRRRVGKPSGESVA
jgi:hypothetical protein